MKRTSCVIICSCCKKEYIVTDIDFVNDRISYIVDDARCTLDTISFKDIDSITFK